CQKALLLNGCRFSIALRDDQTPQRRTVFPWNLLPSRLARMLAETNCPVRLLVGEEDAPAVIGHLHVTESGPTFCIDRSRRTQINFVTLIGRRAEIFPPVEEGRLPVLQSTLQRPVIRQIYVIRYLGLI